MTEDTPGNELEDQRLDKQPPNQTPPGFDDEGDLDSQFKERQREKEGNRGPDEEPGFGQGA